MSLIFRIVWLWFRSFCKKPLPVEKPKNTLTLRVLPNDIDLNLHMNNGRYLTICDLNRIDMFIRTGLVRLMIKNKWMPVISEHTMQYKKPLNLLKKYQVKMEITGWDDRAFFMSHTFLVDERVVAEGTSRGVFVSRQGVISPERVMQALYESRGEAGHIV